MNVDIIGGQMPSPFVRPTGEINVQKLCRNLDIDRAVLQKAMGVKRQTVAHYFGPGAAYVRLRKPETREFFTKLNLVYVLLLAVMGKNAVREKIVSWFHAPNKALGMKSPQDLVREKRLDVLIKKLMDAANAAQGG